VSEPTDFRTPFMAVAIRNNAGNVLPLWAIDENSPAASEFPNNKGFAWVQEVTVELNLGDVPVLSAQLTPTFREGMEFLDSSFIHYGNAELQIQIGYTDPKIAPLVFTGMLLEPSITIGTEMSITLNAHGVGGFAALRNEAGRTSKEGETRLELIKRIAAGPGGKSSLTVDDSEVRGEVLGAALGGSASSPEDSLKGDTAKLLDAPITYSQGGKSDWNALWELVNGANAWMLLVSQSDEPGKETTPVLKILARDKSLSQPPKRVLRLYDLNDGRIGSPSDPSVVPNNASGSAPVEYPILSLSNPPAAIYLPSEVRGIVMEEISDKTPESENKAVLNEENVRATRSAKGTAANEDTAGNPTRDEDTNEGGARIPGDPEDPGAVEAGAMEYRRAGNMGIQLEVETIGIPDIAPGETVLLLGVGKRLGTPRWGVHKVVHTVGTGGFTTSLTVVSNSDAILPDGIPHKDQANTEDAKGEDGLLAKVK
jgi:hypothetical protein